MQTNREEEGVAAAILQQTAEYIYQLEQQKTQLLSQNLQLKRLVDQHEGGDVPTKKRKGDHGVVMSLPVHVSESGDEGLGSMSPEPLSVITVPSDGHSAAAASPSSAELAELKRQLDRERAQRSLLEKEMRNLQSQITYPERIREEQIIYGHQEVIEHTNNVLGQEIDESGITGGLQVIPLVSVPTVGSTQTVETSNADSDTPPLSPQPGCEMIVASDGGPGSICDEHTETQTQSQRENKEVSVNDLLQIESRPGSPKLVSFGGVTVFASNLDGSEQVSVATEEFSPAVLEAAIKAEPKVEVERLPSPSNSLDDGVPQARLYLANTSRQNLETIVEAIRHLEGDHLFGDEPAQDVPLALTNKPAVSVAAAAAAVAAATGTVAGKRLLHAEVNNFLQFHNQTQQQQNSSTTTTSGPSSGATQQPSGSSSRTQQRPGVIVVKHS
ncbi:hypothetical protein QAD02_004005 [Eretmocerus hayati]|uniref:Uncharacterized protein n=1 Tax=Eretmocerus hayati TaxID=131215 RepID=A0ACC2NNA4_9HYME|nr:hypothetical protein QAD02_004005 [Eretmocerus hayati]